MGYSIGSTLMLYAAAFIDVRYTHVVGWRNTASLQVILYILLFLEQNVLIYRNQCCLIYSNSLQIV